MLGSGAVLQDERGVRRGDQGGDCLEEKDGVRLVEAVECHLVGDNRLRALVCVVDGCIYGVYILERLLCERSFLYIER